MYIHIRDLRTVFRCTYAYEVYVLCSGVYTHTRSTYCVQVYLFVHEQVLSSCAWTCTDTVSLKCMYVRMCRFIHTRTHARTQAHTQNTHTHTHTYTTFSLLQVTRSGRTPFQVSRGSSLDSNATTCVRHQACPLSWCPAQPSTRMRVTSTGVTS